MDTEQPRWPLTFLLTETDASIVSITLNKSLLFYPICLKNRTNATDRTVLRINLRVILSQYLSSGFGLRKTQILILTAT